LAGMDATTWGILLLAAFSLFLVWRMDAIDGGPGSLDSLRLVISSESEG
jgi:hypothetical protein